MRHRYEYGYGVWSLGYQCGIRYIDLVIYHIDMVILEIDMGYSLTGIRPASHPLSGKRVVSLGLRAVIDREDSCFLSVQGTLRHSVWDRNVLVGEGPPCRRPGLGFRVQG
jgi:hypothetical protein